jgi:hypothetical protein
MKTSELVENLSDDIISYVMHGEFPEDELAADIKHDQLDERFDDYELLMDLHFILKPEVVDFIRKLPSRIRSIKTQTRNVSRTQRGSVDGKINWSSTIKERYSGNPGDTSLFVTDNRTEHYDIDENIVLKKLLSVIYSTLQDAGEYLEEDYEWVNDRWDHGQIDEMERVFERDVHVKRISDPSEYEPTDRMLNTAENSRQNIYREAADLLDTRNRIFSGEKEELEKLLQETAITPDDEETLFELFVLFKYISTIDDLRDDSFRLKTISSEKQEIARIEGEKDIVLYHDNSAGDRNLSFRPEALEKDEEEDFSRTEKVHREAHNILESYFKNDRFQNQTGRPDVIVLEIIDEDKNEFDYLITEVKNSTNQKTIHQGIKETLEYLAFLRVDEELVFGDEDNEEYFGESYSGILVIQDIEDRETQDIEDQQAINILQASELEEELPDILDEVVNS